MSLTALLVSLLALGLAVGAHLRPWLAARALDSADTRRRRLEMSRIVNGEKPPNGTPWQHSPKHNPNAWQERE